MNLKSAGFGMVGLITTLLPAACGTASGTMQGNVLILTPVPGTGPATARFTSTVVAKENGHLVATQRVSPGQRFRFVLPPGTYTLGDSSAHNCGGSAIIRSGQITTVDVRCVEP